MYENMIRLAQINASGAPFLLAYGITWTICGVLWRTKTERTAAFATLFQGGIALPAALGILFLIGGFDNRPDEPLLQSFAILNAMSQLLVLPLLIAMHIRKKFTTIPFVFSAAGAVHFLLYSWLYQSTGYIVMSMALAILLGILYGYKATEKDPDHFQASLACLGTGAILLIHALFLLFFR